MDRVLNFYAGPSALPLSALEEAKDEILDWQGTGMSVMEISHRSKEFDLLHNETIALFKSLFFIPDDFDVLLLQGGASLQFAMIPMNLLHGGRTADYVVTGRFSNNAYKTAKKVAQVHLSASTEEDGKFFRLPTQSEIDMKEDSVYCHCTSNNTIFGSQWKSFPDAGGIPLVCDMSSDILSRKIDWSPFGLVYAGAQKNLGPAGVTVVVIRKDLVEQSDESLPDILSYRVMADKNSLYNTPGCFSIYMVHKVLKWVKSIGGLDAVEKRNGRKAALLYGMIDNNPSFFISRVEKESRSFMNVTFNLPSAELEAKFIADAKSEGIIGIKGHRSVGGIRVSNYNSHDEKDTEAVASFMKGFMNKNG